MGVTPGGGDSGLGLGRGRLGLTGVESGEGLVAAIKCDGGEKEEDFWATGVVEGSVIFVVAAGLGIGTKPGGGDRGEGLGAGIKPTTGGRDAGLE